ncbi:LexA family transcriptional regulator [Martelella sp. HB161492]|uniref:LexA family transcriptional regulator n=1 Tax=Martelella sp. HB161492 TaxID=2720726 RepID=UPI0015912B70|nr:LexA family transcriptional regulator [Martelella sp. HB161492]
MTRKDLSVTDKFKALRDRADLSLAALAKAMGYRNSSSIQRYENADLYTKEFLSADIAQKLARAVVGRGSPPITEAEVWALAYPQATPSKPRLVVASYDPDNEFEDTQAQAGFTRERWKPSREGAIPEIDGKLGAGSGQAGEIINIQVGKDTISGHKVVAEWNFPPSYLHNEAKVSPNGAVVMEVVGDSMQPTYMPGDRVIVDLHQNALTTDTVYAISDGYAEPQIKRLQRIPFSEPTEVRIISDNPALETFTVELSRLTIIGRICGHLARK